MTDFDEKNRGGDRNIGEEVIEGLKEALAWTEGRSKTKITQWSCGGCGKDVKLEAEVYHHELPLLCDICQKKDTNRDE